MAMANARCFISHALIDHTGIRNWRKHDYTQNRANALADRDTPFQTSLIDFTQPNAPIVDETPPVASLPW